jgi:hypothetical protein
MGIRPVRHQCLPLACHLSHLPSPILNNSLQLPKPLPPIVVTADSIKDLLLSRRGGLPLRQSELDDDNPLLSRSVFRFLFCVSVLCSYQNHTTALYPLSLVLFFVQNNINSLLTLVYLLFSIMQFVHVSCFLDPLFRRLNYKLHRCSPTLIDIAVK